MGYEEWIPMDFGHIPGLPLPVSRLIQGTMMLGLLERDEAFGLLDGVYAHGCRAFDTAPVYYDQRPEELLGDWLRARGLRAQVSIIEKGCHPFNEVARMNPAALAFDIDRSLAKLGTDHIELYLLHRDDPTVSVDAIVEMLHQERIKGRILAYGASNWTHRRIQQANRYAEQHGRQPFVASSPAFSLAEVIQTWPGCISIAGDAEALAFYQEGHLPLLAWSPLAGGFLTGRFRESELAHLTNPVQLQVIESYASEKNWKRVARLARLAKAKGLSMAELSIAYVVGQPFDVYPVVGCCSAAEFATLDAALRLRLDDPELRWLELQTDEEPGILCP